MVVAFLKAHVPDFNTRQEVVGLSSDLAPWYSDVSSIIHGQIPGVWSKGPFQDDAINQVNLGQLSTYFSKGVHLADSLFKVCLGEELWEKFGTSAKKALIKGMSGHQKQVLGLDAA
jgi:hypothetical protein